MYCGTIVYSAMPPSMVTLFGNVVGTEKIITGRGYSERRAEGVVYLVYHAGTHEAKQQRGGDKIA